jgi:hypothetical protein
LNNKKNKQQQKVSEIKTYATAWPAALFTQQHWGKTTNTQHTFAKYLFHIVQLQCMYTKSGQKQCKTKTKIDRPAHKMSDEQK